MYYKNENACAFIVVVIVVIFYDFVKVSLAFLLLKHKLGEYAGSDQLTNLISWGKTSDI